jgi:hypothetical protein
MLKPPAIAVLPLEHNAVAVEGEAAELEFAPVTETSLIGLPRWQNTDMLRDTPGIGTVIAGLRTPVSVTRQT